jgi:hypothetical protein
MRFQLPREFSVDMREFVYSFESGILKIRCLSKPWSEYQGWRGAQDTHKPIGYLKDVTSTSETVLNEELTSVTNKTRSVSAQKDVIIPVCTVTMRGTAFQ